MKKGEISKLTKTALEEKRSKGIDIMQNVCISVLKIVKT